MNTINQCVWESQEGRGGVMGGIRPNVIKSCGVRSHWKSSASLIHRSCKCNPIIHFSRWASSHFAASTPGAASLLATYSPGIPDIPRKCNDDYPSVRRDGCPTGPHPRRFSSSPRIWKGEFIDMSELLPEKKPGRPDDTTSQRPTACQRREEE